MSGLRCAVVLAMVIAACGDDSATGGGGAGAGQTGGNDPNGGNGSGNGSQGGQGGQGTGAGSEGGMASTGGAPPCTAATLADAVRVTPIAISGASSGRALTAQAGSASVVAWAASDGNVHVTKLDVVDARNGDDLLVAGSQVYGIAATDTNVGLLVSRPPDYMTFVLIDMNGTEIAATNLVGGGDHAVVGVEWFGEFAQTGRLVRQSDGSFAAYHALHRRWPDNIGHQGDTLRLLDAAGTQLGGGWGWGCSHSMDQRLANAPWGIVPVCIADCYPGKGIYFNHDNLQITPDPAANCAGGFSTLLGGLVGTAAGFFLVYQDAQGTAHLGTFDITNGQPAGDRVLAVPGSSRLALYDGGMLLGYDGSIQRLDATGADVGGPAAVTAAMPDGDFESRSDGEVAWASASGANLDVVRVRVCE